VETRTPWRSARCVGCGEASGVVYIEEAPRPARLSARLALASRSSQFGDLCCEKLCCPWISVSVIFDRRTSQSWGLRYLKISGGC
jgi:hypothetical protein